MLKKLILACVATAALGAAALAPSAASAKGGFWPHHHHGWHHHHWAAGPAFAVGLYDYADRGCYVTRRVMTSKGYRLRTFNVCY